MKASKRRQHYQNKPFAVALGAHCRKLRIKKGYSIDRLAKEGEYLSPAAIQRLETGTADVQISLLYRVAEVLEVPITKLFDFDFTERHPENLIIPFEPGEKPPKNLIPFYPIEIAAGLFSEDAYETEPTGWVPAGSRKGIGKDHFAAFVQGKSMEPTIPSGALCLFKRYSGGSRNGQIMLIQAKGLVDPETGGSFVIKRYQRITPVTAEEVRTQVVVHLLSDNTQFTPIVLKNLREEQIATPAVFVDVISS